MTERTGAASLPKYDCFILGGGGAKGAYGAGAAKAVEAFRKKKGLTNPVCYIGSSAGALNACILAASGADKLIQFWLQATQQSVLGSGTGSPTLHAIRRWVTRTLGRSCPFSIYSGKELADLIACNAKLGELKNPLIVASTDYTRGALRAFYASNLIDKLVAEDAKEPAARRRLSHFRQINSDEMLVKALQASSAIPVFFPPVKIQAAINGIVESSWYVDGGVGNLVPTREAAYFFRYLEELHLGIAGVAYSVSQDPPRAIQEVEQSLDFFEILTRVREIFQHIHTAPIVTAWKRINIEVVEQAKKIEAFTAWVRDLPIDDAIKNQIVEHAKVEFGTFGGSTSRLNVPLIQIEPSISLGDALAFDTEQTRKSIQHGYVDTLKVLRHMRDRGSTASQDATYLDEAEYLTLVDAPILTVQGGIRPKDQLDLDLGGSF